MSFGTFGFDYYEVMDNITSCISITWATSVLSSLSINIPYEPTFIELVLPFKWFKRKVHDTCQKLLVFLKNNWPPSTTSIVFSKALLVHFPRWEVARRFFIFVDLFVEGALVNGMFSLSIVDLFLESILSHTRYIKHHGSHLPTSLSLQELGNIWLGLIRGKKFGLL